MEDIAAEGNIVQLGFSFCVREGEVGDGRKDARLGELRDAGDKAKADHRLTGLQGLIQLLHDAAELREEFILVEQCVRDALSDADGAGYDFYVAFFAQVVYVFVKNYFHFLCSS
jgi:hypothetical protein